MVGPRAPNEIRRARVIALLRQGVDTSAITARLGASRVYISKVRSELKARDLLPENRVVTDNLGETEEIDIYSNKEGIHPNSVRSGLNRARTACRSLKVRSGRGRRKAKITLAGES